MSFKSAPFWWLICDAPDCKSKSTDGSDYVAWADPSGAVADAEDCDWAVNGPDEKHYCIEHRGFVCGECDKSEGHEYPLDHDGMCDECWAEDAKQNHGRVTA